MFSFITSNKWMRAGYGQKLRGFLAKHSNPLLLVDFGGVKVFESATVDVNVLVAEKSENIGKTRTVLIDDSCTEDLSVFVEQKKLYNSFTKDDNWIIINDIENQIKAKIEMNGLKLSNWNININRGVLTGYNEAFIIDDSTRKQLILEDEKSAEIIRPILRGRDIDRYSYNFANLYLLYIPWHFPLNPSTIQGASLDAERKFKQQYPAVYNHLLKYKNRLSARNQAETGIRYEWYVLQRYGSNYMEDFFKLKIMYSEIVQKPQFYLDDTNIIPEASTFILVGENLKYLCIMLNSRTISFLFKKFFAGGGLGGNGYRYKKKFLLNLPIVIPNSKTLDIFNEFYDSKKYIIDDELNKLEDLIMDLYGFNSEEKNYIKTNF